MPVYMLAEWDANMNEHVFSAAPFFPLANCYKKALYFAHNFKNTTNDNKRHSYHFCHCCCNASVTYTISKIYKRPDKRYNSREKTT